MATVKKYRNGVPSWADVAVRDAAMCVPFYESLFGWDSDDQDLETDGYHMFRLDGRPVAGLGLSWSEEQPPLWNTYISVDDLDATLVAAEAAGGVVVMPRMDIMTSGSTAVMIDPTGAGVSFWQPGDHLGAETVNVPNTLAWHELTTRDPEKAMAFYGATLGWTFQSMPEGQGADGYQMVMVGDRMVAGIMPMIGEEWGDMPSHWMVYFAVADADVTAAQATELGGAVAVPPFDMSVGRISVCNDPDGNAFSIIALAGPPDAIESGIA